MTLLKFMAVGTMGLGAAGAVLNFLAADRLVFHTQGATMTRRHLIGFVALFSACLAALASAAEAAQPQSETTAAWNAYVQATEERIARELSSPDGFLVQDFAPAPASTRDAAKAGDIGVVKMASLDRTGRYIAVPDGMVHHWRGSVFIPGVTLDVVLARVSNPTARDLAQEDVLHSRVLDRGPGSLQLYLRLQRTQLVTVVYDTEHAIQITRHGRTRASSSSVATRIVEVANPGTPNERAKPAGQDRGFLRRLNSYWRYEQADGGVIVECESISLSRSVPSLLAATIRPVIDHVARGSMERTLSSLRVRFGN